MNKVKLGSLKDFKIKTPAAALVRNVDLVFERLGFL
jgi:hypothetical protein